MVNSGDQHQTWTTEVENFCLPKESNVWLCKAADGGGVVGLFFSAYDKIHAIIIALLSFDAVSWHLRACVDCYLKPVLISMAVVGVVVPCLCSLSNSQCAYRSACKRSIETETIWMNKLHIMLKINERYFNWIECFFFSVYQCMSKRARTKRASINQ